jgi:hypothetical protein
MASGSPTRALELAGFNNKSNSDREPYGTSPAAVEGAERPVVADCLARKLSARQVQMIAIG